MAQDLQETKALDMRPIVELYNSGHGSINKTFEEFFLAMRPMFKGTPDFIRVAASHLVYKNGTKWSNEDYNAITKMLLNSDNPCCWTETRVDDINPENWARIVDLLKNNKLDVDRSTPLYQKYLKEAEQKLKDHDELSKELESFKQKCSVLEKERDDIQRKYEVLEKTCTDLKAFADDWANRVGLFAAKSK